MDDQQSKFRNLLWFSGFFDGEGSIILVPHSHAIYKDGRQKRYKPKIVVAGTDFQTLEDLIQIYSENEVPYHIEYRHPKNPNWASSWMLTTVGLKRCLRWLNAFQAYLKTKSEESQLMREFIQVRFSGSQKSPYSKEELEVISKIRNKKVRKSFNDYTPGCSNKEQMV